MTAQAQVRPPQHSDERTFRVMRNGSIKPVMERYCVEHGWQDVNGSLSQIIGCPKCGRSW